MLKYFTIIALFFNVILLPSSIALAQSNGGTYGLEATANKANYASNGQKSGDLFSTVGNIVAIFLSVLAFIFFGMTMYAGVRWMTARGNEEYVTKAKDTLEGAIIGLVVVLLSYALVSFVFSKLGA